MANFSSYYPKLLVYEGGYASASYAKKMGDKGGETYLGIARNYNSTWEGWKIIDDYKLKNGEPKYGAKLDIPSLYKLAEELTKLKYWDKLRLDLINNQSLAEQIMDYGYNSGLTTSAKTIQGIIKSPTTGVFTDNDVMLINRLSAEDTFKKLQASRVDMITKSTKINPKFKVGLLKRANSFVFVA